MIIVPIRKKIEAILWIKKYFIVFSNARSPSIDIKGKKLNILNSKQTQNMTIEFLLSDTYKLANRVTWNPSVGDISIDSQTHRYFI